MTKKVGAYIPVINNLLKGVIRDFTGFGSFLVIFVLIILFTNSVKEFLLLSVGLVVLEIITIILKLSIFKHRPEKENFTNLLEKILASSFPSSHAARSAFVFSYFSQVYFGSIKGYMFVVLIIIVVFSRIVLKRHYQKDVVAGVIIGLIFYILYGFFISNLIR